MKYLLKYLLDQIYFKNIFDIINLLQLLHASLTLLLRECVKG
jgi:hypothetical protein